MTKDLIPAAVDALREKIVSFPHGVVKFVLPDHGTIMIGPDGVREGDDPADVTMTASAEVFRGIFEGTVNPTAAFMTGKLTIDGAMGIALKLAGQLA